MDIQGKSILILGGAGLVGRAVARRMFGLRPKTIILSALTEAEVTEAAEELRGEAADTAIETVWGNVFLPADAARLDRAEMLADDRLRTLVIGDMLGDLTDEMIQRSFLYQLFRRYKPHAVVDCINTATAFAYQDVFHSARDLLDAAHAGGLTSRQVEEHVLTLPMPQLIRHIQLIVEAMRVAGTQAYAKIGTSGTGGMGLNIPYTHSEERPSRTLLSKSAVAGAQTLLLYLVARTPGAPAVVEVKPTAAIAWREIRYGPVRRGQRAIAKYDCPRALSLEEAFGPGAGGWTNTGAVLESVYVHTGENGSFARDEFETVTALGQMEFITPEEVADYVVMELAGRPTGRDVVAALDAATAGPTYKAGILRSSAVERLKALEQEHGIRAVAFEMLGPPRLTKLLYEAFIMSRLRSTVRQLAESDAQEIAERAAALVVTDADLRSTIVSVGLPILVEGDEVYRGERTIVPYASGDDLNRTVARGWVDLRPENCATWVARARRVVSQSGMRRSNSGSGNDWGALGPEDVIAPSRFATWIFRYEDDGERMKR